MNGNLIGKFKSLETGKYNIKINDFEKNFYVGLSNNKEIENVKSSEELIKSFFQRSNKYMYSINWLQENMIKITIL